MQTTFDMEDAPAARGGMGTWHSKGPSRDEWLTPPWIVRSLGAFDLDPCSPVRRPWDTAGHHYNIMDDGLKQAWMGRVWMNPPYGSNTAAWMERMAAHGNGVALIFARTETATFFPWVWDYAAALLFLKGRIAFHFSDGTKSPTAAGAPSVLIAYGAANVEALRLSGISGKLILNG